MEEVTNTVLSNTVSENTENIKVVENWDEDFFIKNGYFEFLDKEKLGKWMKENHCGEPKLISQNNIWTWI